MGPPTMNRQREVGHPSKRVKGVLAPRSSRLPLSPQRLGGDESNLGFLGFARSETCVTPGRGNISGCSVQSPRGRVRRLPRTGLSASIPQPEEEPMLVTPSQEEMVDIPPRVLHGPCLTSRRRTRQREVRALQYVPARSLRRTSSQVAVTSQNAVSDIATSTGEEASASRGTIIVNPTNSPNRSVANPVGAVVSRWRIQALPVPSVPPSGSRNTQAPTMRMSTGRSVSVRSSNTLNPSHSGPKTRSSGRSNPAAKQNQINSLTLKATGRRKQTQPVTQMLLRAAAKRLPVPCKHAPSGCAEMLVPSELDKHASVCDFRPYSCPLSSEKCKWMGELDEMVTHLHEMHPNVEQQKGPIIKIVVTNITQPAPMRWFIVQTCLGKHFLIMIEKLVRHGHSMFFGTAKILGSSKEAKAFECKMAVKHPKKTLSYTTVVRTLRSGQEAVIERDCLALDERSADSFAVDHNLLVEVGISMI